MDLRALATGSGAERWTNCPASVALGKDIVEGEKSYATEGTRLHDEVAQALTTILKEQQRPKTEDPHVLTCLRLIQSCGNFSIIAEKQYGIEKRFDLLGSSGGIDFYYISGKTCNLFDWKFGVGKKVDCFENLQIAFYACCLKEAHPHITRVNAWICQPKVEGLFEDTAHITQWSLGYQALAAYRRMFERALGEVEQATKFQSGTHCQFCKAKGCCPAYVAYADVTEEQQANLPASTFETLPAIDIPRICRILAARKRVETWFDKAHEFLLGMAIQDKDIEQIVRESGFELGQKRTYRKWNTMMEEQEVADALRERGLEDPYEHSLISITKAEKICDITDLVEKPEGALTLRLIKK